MLLLFHLSLGAGGSACQSHDDQVSDDQHAAMQMGGSRPAASDDAPLDCSSSHEQCPAPVTPDCCTAMASCALFVSAAGADAIVALTAQSSPLADLLNTSSGATRSETPPPRA